MNNAACVYVLKNENSIIKIGFSNNPKERMSSIQSLGGYEIIDHYFSPECTNYVEIEKMMHKEFASYRKIGEWFNVSFDVAVLHLKTLPFNTNDIKDVDDFRQHNAVLSDYEEDCDTLEKLNGESRKDLIMSLDKMAKHYGLSQEAIEDLLSSYESRLQECYPMFPGYYFYLKKKFSIDCLLLVKIDIMVAEDINVDVAAHRIINTIEYLLMTKADDGLKRLGNK